MKRSELIGQERPHRLTVYVEDEIMEAIRSELPLFGSESAAARALLMRGMAARTATAPVKKRGSSAKSRPRGRR